MCGSPSAGFTLCKIGNTSPRLSQHHFTKGHAFTSTVCKLRTACRIGDNDARCGPSSIQKFDGEDLAAAERSQAQHQQCYDWWEAQRAQHEAQKAAQAEATLREQEAVSALANAICCAPSCACLSHSDLLQIC